jgi:hypothetical protein
MGTWFPQALASNVLLLLKLIIGSYKLINVINNIESFCAFSKFSIIS